MLFLNIYLGQFTGCGGYLARLETARYISDGDPDIITILESAQDKLNEDSLEGKTLRTYTLKKTE